MSQVVHTLFGGSSSKSKSESGNLAYPWESSTFEPGAASAFNGGIGAMSQALGIGTSNPLQSYWNSGGGQFQLNQGLGSLTDKYASMGLLKSGSAMKAMENYRQGLASTYSNNWMSGLNNLSSLGLNAGSLVSNAGQYSKSKSSADEETGNAGKFLGMLLSDRRLKTNIEKVGEASDGLSLYTWNWKSDPKGPVQRGVIADEVEKLRPWAFVPNFRGEFAGVNYAALGSLA